MKQKSVKKTVKSAPDKENPEWTKEDFKRAVPFDRLPAEVQKSFSAQTRGPQIAPKKVPVSIRLSADVVKALRGSGAGWQSRVDDILRAHIK
ncbi:MAG: BrnA antitoxin family protein [Acidobacteria bacterium]|nr:BrnA antitoxin family protein [Acidobacteriota bacterium]